MAVERRYGSTDDANDSDASSSDDDNDFASVGSSSAPLMTGGKKKKKAKESKRRSGTTTVKNSLRLVVALAALSLGTLCFRLNRQLRSISAELSSQSRRVDTLEGAVREQAGTIGRFADGVSNSDVLKSLASLQGELNTTRSMVEQELEDAGMEVRKALDDTVLVLDESVDAAKAVIRQEVETVRADFRQYAIQTESQFSTANSFMIYQLAGTFTLLTCLISAWHMTAHLRRFRQPTVQRKILAILWMTPIYGVTSWLSLVFPSLEGYLAILKDLYEAYVIYTFLSFCIAVLGRGNREAVVDALTKHADHLSPPMSLRRCLIGPVGWMPCFKNHSWKNDPYEGKPRELADAVLYQCQLYAMQFVFLRPLITASEFVLHKFQYYGGADGPNDWRAPQLYLTVILNVSVFVAFSGLLKFYHAVQDELAWCSPFPKFLCIKGVVFMTFWQGLVISILSNTTDMLGGGKHENVDDGGSAEFRDDDLGFGLGNGSDGSGDGEDATEVLAKQTQNFLICLEMLGFSIAHFYCFPTEEWEEGYRPAKDEEKTKFADKMALGDFMHDLKSILRSKQKDEKRSKGGKVTSALDENSVFTVLEEDEETGNGNFESTLNFRESHGASSSDEDDNGDHSILDDSTKESENAIATAPRKRKQSKSLAETMDAMDAPPELRQATALLLQSSLLDETTAKMLASDILDHTFEADDEEGDGNENENETTADGEDYEGTTDGALADDDGAATTVEDEEGPMETSSLLQTISNMEEILRPSIFTCYDDQGEQI